MMKNILIRAASVGAWLEMPKIVRTFPQTVVLVSLDDFTEVGVETVIAAPGALHAKKAVDALERGRGIFRQKSPNRSVIETRPTAVARWRKASIYESYIWSLQNPVIDSVFKHPKQSTLAV
jgi:hypothetical protein